MHEALNEGIDTVQSGFDLDLRDYANVENGILSGDLVSELVGTDDANRLRGNGVGSRLVGLGGNDIYVITGPDSVVEARDGGHDTIETAVGTVDLADNVEDLTSIGTGLQLTGNGLGNRITGDDGDNIVHGEGGSDTLIGRDGKDRLDGGSGNDVINGGKGDDVIIGGVGDDLLVGGGGLDTYIVGIGSGKDRLVNGVQDVDNGPGRLLIGMACPETAYGCSGSPTRTSYRPPATISGSAFSERMIG